MDAVVLTREYFPDRTEGNIILPDGETIYTLERPWLNNKANKSCIPAGVYKAQWLERSGSGKYKRVWHLQDVPGRSGILIHSGNLVRHTLGCILPGMKFGTIENSPAVLSSGTALSRLRNSFEGSDFLLIIA